MKIEEKVKFLGTDNKFTFICNPYSSGHFQKFECNSYQSISLQTKPPPSATNHEPR
jgi:hypothetical protein